MQNLVAEKEMEALSFSQFLEEFNRADFFPHIWDSLNLEEKRVYLSETVEYVKIFPNRLTVKLFSVPEFEVLYTASFGVREGT